MTTAADIIRAARSYLRAPYRHKGRGAGGVDCVGLLLCVARDLGILPASLEAPPYGREPSEALVQMLDRWCARIDAPRPGCVVTMRWFRIPRHVGIYTGPTLIHAHEMLGGVVEHGINDAWRRRFTGYWWAPGVES